MCPGAVTSCSVIMNVNGVRALWGASLCARIEGTLRGVNDPGGGAGGGRFFVRGIKVELPQRPGPGPDRTDHHGLRALQLDCSASPHGDT